MKIISTRFERLVFVFHHRDHVDRDFFRARVLFKLGKKCPRIFVFEKDIEDYSKGLKTAKGLPGFLDRTNWHRLVASSLQVALVNEKCFRVVVEDQDRRTGGIYLPDHLRNVVDFGSTVIREWHNHRKS